MSRKLTDLHPILQELALKLIRNCKEMGISIVLTQTLRTFAEQDVIYAQGRTKPGRIVTNARGGESYHNYGLAFDVAVKSKYGLTWDELADTNDDLVADYHQVGEIAEELGLEWGGRWKFRDIPHYQYTFGLSIKDLKAGKLPPTTKSVV